MSTELELSVAIRKAGKSSVRKLRQSQNTPAILYGAKQENQCFSVEEKLVVKYQAKLREHPIFILKSSDSKLNGQIAMIKEITVHPVSRKPVHVDFVRITKGQVIKANVEIVLTGKSIGIKEGGNLNVLNHEIEVEAVPNKIPDKIEHDISSLNINESIHVSDLKIPSDIKVLTSGEITIATIAMVKAEPEATAEPVAGEAAAATPEDKKEEEKKSK